MKNVLTIIGIIAISGFATFVSCNKVTFPNVITTNLDTTLYPGNFAEYVFPVFEENTNTEKNVVIADYTGHQCPFCPPAATQAESIEAANPGRVFVAAIHASPENDGTGDFQKVTDDFPRDFTNPQGLEMAIEFFNLGVGFTSNPKGTINRVPRDDGFYFLSNGEWSAKTDEVLASTLDVNIQAKSSYFPETNAVFLHTETVFLNDLDEGADASYNIVVYALEDEIVSPQKLPDGSTDEDYVHHDVHIGNVFDETWGRGIASGTVEAGTKVENDFSYVLPDGLTNDDMHFLVLVFNRQTYEIKQVIKHKF